MARQSRRPTILLTRPEPQSRRFAARLAEVCDLPVLVAPLMQVRFLAPNLDEVPYQGLIFTSETGVQASLPLAANLPRRAYCVGRRTAEVAAAAGFDATSADGDAAALAAMLLAAPPPGPVLHLRGAETRGGLAETLTKGGLVTHEAIVYDQESRPLDPAARTLLQGTEPVILPLFSPRSARLAAAEMPQPHAPLWVVALSPAVADAAAALRPVRRETARRPDADAMLAALAALVDAGLAP